MSECAGLIGHLFEICAPYRRCFASKRMNVGVGGVTQGVFGVVVDLKEEGCQWRKKFGG